MEPSIVGQFISTLLASRTQAHIFHWQTTGEGSFAAHAGLNVYYDNIVEIVDGLVESYQGKYDIVTGYTNIALQEFQKCEDVILYFTTLVNYLEKSRTLIAQDSYIQNQVDELVAEIYSLLYKLKSFKK